MNIPPSAFSKFAAETLPSKEERVGIHLALLLDKARALADCIPEIVALVPDHARWQETFGRLAAEANMMQVEIERTLAIHKGETGTTKGRLQ